MIAMILHSQLAAVISGEWHLMKPRIYWLFGLGLSFLVIAVLTMGVSKYLEG
jgi:hypothetical protein